MELHCLKGDTDEPEYVLYMFINSTSGGNAGKQFFDLDMDSIRFLISGHEVLVRFYDLKDIQSVSKGLRRLKMHMGKVAKDKLRIIISGGDGTVGWVLNILSEAGVKLEELVFGILPLGTGNDFSRALNWGPGEEGDVFGHKFTKFKGLVANWITADIKNFDVWHAKVTVYENGHFQKIQNKTSTLMEQEYLSRDFTNYCGFGIDGQIGYDFDKVRSESRAINMLMYAGVGFLNLFKQPKGVQQLVDRMTLEGQEVFNNQGNNNIYTSRLKGGFKNILALNLNSFMGGVADIWQTPSTAVQGSQNQVYQPQRYDDGLLQFVSWKNQMQLALEMVINKAYRVAQGSGPFQLQFKQIDDKNHHTYLQIDGQFFKVYHPKEISYYRSQLTPTGQIKVLSRVLQETKQGW